MGAYQEGWQRFRAWAKASNGTEGEAEVPKLKREQAAAILRYAMHLSATSLPDFNPGAWYPIALSLLGWSKPGDKFRLDASWRNAFGDVVTTAALWQFTLDAAIEADNRTVPFKTPRPRPTEDYGVTALKAWERMKADDPKSPVPIRPYPVSPVSPEDAEAERKKPKPKPGLPGPGLGGSALLVLLLFLMHKSS
jgi:hypothetical protein